jgi:hypothetical protein
MLRMGNEVEQKCEWTCLLWSKDHWATEARKAQITLQQAKERPGNSEEKSKTLRSHIESSQFLNTVAQIYSKLFDDSEQFCSVKDFTNCPFMRQRHDLLSRGSLASVFVTILHKATLYFMLDNHPIDSGLLDEEYSDVYGIDLTSFQDLERSLTDGRFAKLFDGVVKRASELSGLKSKEPL